MSVKNVIMFLGEKIMSNKFKVGDKVKFTQEAKKFYSSTALRASYFQRFKDATGTIIKIYGNYTRYRYKVSWRLGFSYMHQKDDLELFCSNKSKTNCYKCKDRLKCITRGLI